MTRAFVTGISGQDGTYLAERLLADGIEVHGLQHAAEPPSPYCPSEVVLHHGDLADLAATARLVRDLAPDEVYHLAAISSVARAWAEPGLTRLVNETAALALLDVVTAIPGARFVQASSAEIFGSPAACPQDEDTPLAPTNPYGAAKAAVHRALAERRAAGAHASGAILFNHESPRRPPAFVTRTITRGVAAIAAGRADELVLGNLDVRRDWGWAPDHVAALVLMARADTPADYVVATGQPHTVRDFAAAAFAAAGIADWQGLVRLDDSRTRPRDAVSLVGNPARIRRDLGWSPTVPFDEIVSRMVAADVAAVA